MAQTIPDIYVDNSAWVDINTATGIVVGVKMQITNKTNSWCRIYEGVTAPDVDSKDGDLITNLHKPSSRLIKYTDSLKIWALSASDCTVKLSVQELLVV